MATKPPSCGPRRRRKRASVFGGVEMDVASLAASILNTLSGLFAVGAAILWWRSSQVKSPTKFPIQILTMHVGNYDIAGGEVISSGDSPELDAIGRALIEQSRLSGNAAISAPIAAAFQVMAFVLPAVIGVVFPRLG
jgi:hypothetical protein